MLRKIKKLLKNNLKPKVRLLVIVLLFLSIIGIMVPAGQAHAFSVLDIGKGVLFSFVNIVFGSIFQILAALGGFFMDLSGAILDWVTSPGFTSYSFTNPNNNPVLEIGWKLVRDLTNMGFVIVLVVIGLCTALKLKDYEVKKLLPTLIFIAILINFTPVICGLVVDASNILTSFFLNASGSWQEGFGSTFSFQVEMNAEISKDTKPWDDLSFVGASMAFCLYTFLGGIILLLYATLFFMRYIAIWILVILSPLAFFSYILPATRKYFKMWWSQFLQWSFVGAAASFFLYLSYRILYLYTMDDISLVGSSDLGDAIGEGGGSFDAILPFFVVIAFLYIGFFVSFSTGAAGASGVISGAQGLTKKYGKATGKWTAKAPLKAGATLGAVPGVERKVAAVRRRMESIPGLRATVGGIGAYSTGLAKKKEAAAKPMAKYSVDDLRKITTRTPLSRKNRLEQAAALEQLAKKGALKETDRSIVKTLQDYGLNTGDILKKMPHWAPDVGKTTKSVLNKTAPSEVRKNIQTEALENLDVFYSMNAKHLKDFEKNGTPKQLESILKTVHLHTPEIDTQRERFEQNNQLQEAENLVDKQSMISLWDKPPKIELDNKQKSTGRYKLPKKGPLSRNNKKESDQKTTLV